MSQRMELLSTNGSIQKLRLNFNLKQMRNTQEIVTNFVDLLKKENAM